MKKEIIAAAFALFCIAPLALAQDCPKIFYQTNEEGTYFSTQSIFRDGQDILLDILSKGQSTKVGPLHVPSGSALGEFVANTFLQYGDDVRAACAPTTEAGQIPEALSSDLAQDQSPALEVSRPEGGEVLPNEDTGEKEYEDVSGRSAVCFGIVCGSPNTTKIVRNNIDVVFLVDISGTMGQPLANGKRRIDYAKQHLLAAMDKFDSKFDRVGIVTFGNAGKIVSGGFDASAKFPKSRGAISSLVAGERTTNIADGLKKAMDLFAANPKSGSKKVLILLSDGVPNNSTNGECDESYPSPKTNPPSGNNKCVVDSRDRAKTAVAKNDIQLNVVGYALQELESSEGQTLRIKTEAGFLTVNVPEEAAKNARQLLRDMAKGDDYYFESETLSDLNSIFDKIITKSKTSPPPVCDNSSLELRAKGNYKFSTVNYPSKAKLLGMEQNNSVVKWNTGNMTMGEIMNFQVIFDKDYKVSNPGNLVDFPKSLYRFVDSSGYKRELDLGMNKASMCVKPEDKKEGGLDIAIERNIALNKCVAHLTFKVTCIGNYPQFKCQDIYLSDKFPVYASYIAKTFKYSSSLQGGGAVYDNSFDGMNGVRFSLGDMVPGESKTIEFDVSLNYSGSLPQSGLAKAQLNYTNGYTRQYGKIENITFAMPIPEECKEPPKGELPKINIVSSVKTEFDCYNPGSVNYIGTSSIALKCEGQLNCQNVSVNVAYSPKYLVRYAGFESALDKVEFSEIKPGNLRFSIPLLAAGETEYVNLKWQVDHENLEKLITGSSLKNNAALFNIKASVFAGKDVVTASSVAEPAAQSLPSPQEFALCRRPPPPRVEVKADFCTECGTQGKFAYTYFKGAIMCKFNEGCSSLSVVVRAPKKVTVAGARKASESPDGTVSYAVAFNREMKFGETQPFNIKFSLDKASMDLDKDKKFDITLEYMATSQGGQLDKISENQTILLPLEEYCGCYQFSGELTRGSNLKAEDFDISRYVMIVADLSESMNVPANAPDRAKFLEQYRQVIKGLYGQINTESGKDNIGIIEASHGTAKLKMTNNGIPLAFTQNINTWNSAVDSLSYGGTTNLAKAINMAHQALITAGRAGDVKVMLILSEGLPTEDGGYTDSETRNSVAKAVCHGSLTTANFMSDQCVSAAIREARAAQKNKIDMYAAWYIYETDPSRERKFDIFEETPKWSEDARDIKDKAVAKAVGKGIMERLGYFQNSGNLPYFNPDDGSSALAKAFGCDRDSKMTIEGILPSGLKFITGSAKSKGAAVAAEVIGVNPQKIIFPISKKMSVNYQQFDFSFYASAPFGMKEVESPVRFYITCLQGRKQVEKYLDLTVTRATDKWCPYAGSCQEFK